MNIFIFTNICKILKPKIYLDVHSFQKKGFVRHSLIIHNLQPKVPNLKHSSTVHNTLMTYFLLLPQTVLLSHTFLLSHTTLLSHNALLFHNTLPSYTTLLSHAVLLFHNAWLSHATVTSHTALLSHTNLISPNTLLSHIEDLTTMIYFFLPVS